MSTSTKASDTKDAMFHAELMHEKLNQLEQHLQQLEQQHKELGELISSLDSLAHVSSGDDTLVSIAPGIFARGSLSNTDDLLVGVGAGIFVKKTLEDVHISLQEQLSHMEEFERDVRKDFTTTLAELNTFKERFK